MDLKRFLIGEPIATEFESKERLNKAMGLAVFSSDALSSVAYGPEEIMIVLVAAGAALTAWSLPIAIGITGLVLLVAFSYFQTIHAYPGGGGAYIVAHDNLGPTPGLVAGSALLIDYVLTVTVSVSAGIAAITSAVPALQAHHLLLCCLAVVIIVVVNLRGVRETGRAVSIPVFIFIGGVAVLLAKGLYGYYTGDLVPPAPLTSVNTLGLEQHPLLIFFLLRAFASGCATLTGIEAVSNGVKAFRSPEARNAGLTLIIMAAILGSFSLGITFLFGHLKLAPNPDQTMMSELARILFGVSPIYYIIQFSTSFILILAANTSFADFPRLSSIMAHDGYLPRSLSMRGDRLVFSNGIILLGVLSVILLVIFRGDVHLLIPLYAVGVFTAFSLSQTGMVKHWWKLRGPRWRIKLVFNGLGAVATIVVLIVIAVTKFIHGAWMVVVAVPLLVSLTFKIKAHYQSVARQLTAEPVFDPPVTRHHSVLVPVSGLQRASANALEYARSLSGDVTALYVAIDAAEGERFQAEWETHHIGIPLIIIFSPFRSIAGPLMSHIDKLRVTYPDGIITIVLPEFHPKRWWHNFLHNQTALFLKTIMPIRKGVVVTSVPFQLTD